MLSGVISCMHASADAAAAPPLHLSFWPTEEIRTHREPPDHKRTSDEANHQLYLVVNLADNKI